MMAEHDVPASDETMAGLYDLAERFLQEQPWNSLTDENGFCIPSTIEPEPTICSVLGADGLAYGLEMFPGIEGHRTLEAFLGDSDAEFFAAMPYVRSLTLTFEARDQLEPHQWELISRLGRDGREPPEWPAFASKRPGYASWALTEGEAAEMRCGLECALHLCALTAERPPNWSFDDEALPLVALVGDTDIQLTWHRFDALPPREFRAAPVPQERIDAALNSAARTKQPWEMDAFHTNVRVGEEGTRQMVPQAVAVMEAATGDCAALRMLDCTQWPDGLPGVLLDAIDEKGRVPSELRIESEELQVALAPTLDALGIRAKKARLYAVEEIRARFLGEFEG